MNARLFQLHPSVSVQVSRSQCLLCDSQVSLWAASTCWFHLVDFMSWFWARGPEMGCPCRRVEVWCARAAAAASLGAARDLRTGTWAAAAEKPADRLCPDHHHHQQQQQLQPGCRRSARSAALWILGTTGSSGRAASPPWSAVAGTMLALTFTCRALLVFLLSEWVQTDRTAVRPGPGVTEPDLLIQNSWDQHRGSSASVQTGAQSEPHTH